MNPKFITTLQYNKAQIPVPEDEYYLEHVEEFRE